MAHRPASILLAGLVVLGCESPATQTPYPPCVESETLELGTLLVEVESLVDGTVRGVDLDGRDSDVTDDFGCNQEDWDDPDGSPVDSQFTSLLPTVEAAFGMESRDIFSGNPLTLHVRGRGDGVCAAVSVAVGDGPWRTAEWNGSTLRAYDLGEVLLRTSPPAGSETVTLRDAAVRITVAEGRVATVILSGALDVEELLPIAAASLEDIDGRLIRTIFDGVADLEPDRDGICTEISVALEALP